MQYGIEIDGIKDFNKYMKKVEKGTRDAIVRATAETATKIQGDARRAAPVDTGQLRIKIQQRVTDKVGVVWSGAKYSEDVEFGREDGTWANPYELMGWVKRNLKVPRSKLKSVTFLVNRKIYEFGTKARPYFFPAVEKHEKRYVKRIMQLIKKI